MELTPKHLEIIGDYVRGHIAEWIEPVKVLTLDEWHRDMQERVIRIEETVRLGFDFMEKRFEQVEKHFDQQFKFITVGFLMIGVLMSVYQFLA